MASPKLSFIFVTPEEFENCRKASAEAATTASLPVTVTACKHPRFLALVGVVSKLKKTNESLDTSSHDSTLHNARVTIPVFADGGAPQAPCLNSTRARLSRTSEQTEALWITA